MLHLEFLLRIYRDSVLDFSFTNFDQRHFTRMLGPALRTYFYLLPWPNCSAYKAAQPLSPPLFFMNGMRRTRGFLDRAAYRRARLHLLMVLRSNFFSQVQRMTTANGSAFISIISPANLNARRISLLVRRRPR